jgi:hypothetical protein
MQRAKSQELQKFRMLRIERDSSDPGLAPSSSAQAELRPAVILRRREAD